MAGRARRAVKPHGPHLLEFGIAWPPEPFISRYTLLGANRRGPRRGCRRGPVRLLLTRLGLVVPRVGVDAPEVVARAVEVLDRADRGEHRVVAVVVAVQPVAPDLL